MAGADKFPCQEGIAVPGRPFRIVARSSLSDFIPRTVKSAAGGINIFPLGPSLCPFEPWQLMQEVVEIALPLLGFTLSVAEKDHGS